MPVSVAAGPVSAETGPAAGDRGSVTVEAALGVCCIVAVLVLGVGAAAMVIGQLRCTDAAVESAKLVARGERERAEAAVAKLAPGGAALNVVIQGDEVTTEVSATVAGGVLPGKWLKARAFAVLEPAETGSGPGGAGP